MRQKFNDNLPHISTIRKWYMNSSASGEPGYCKESFDTLRNMAANHTKNGKQIFCSLVFDEMSIRKHLQWSDSRKEFLGSINYGFRSTCEEMPLAKNALVFLLKGINVNFTMPMAFYFIETLNAVEKHNLLQEILIAISACGVRVLSITFDGFSANFSMSKLLGANLKASACRLYFYLPDDDRKIFIILDPSHMEKLARNCIAGNKVLLDENDAKFEWHYFESLEMFRNEKNLTLTHKLTKKHMQWFRCKMNVRLAAETLSNSVAASMQFLMDKNFPEFSNASATIKYIRVMNDLFDIMNSKRILSSNSLKSAINPLNHEFIFKYFENAIEYLKKIKLSDGRTVICTALRTAFRGFIINMISLKSIYEECIESGLMDYLPTFKFSQDHLESLFGRIRSMNGYNDNPTVEQFCAAFRKIVVNNEITSSELSNCVDSLNILYVSSGRPKLNSTQSTPNDKKSEYEIFLDNIEHMEEKEEIENCDYLLDDLEKTSVAYTAGWIEKKIDSSDRYICVQCVNLFYENDKVLDYINSAKTQAPYQTTFKICKIAQKFIKSFVKDPTYKYLKLLNNIMREIDYENAYPKTNFEGHESHKYDLIKAIVEEYIRIQVTYTAKRVTLNEQKTMMRNHLKKLIFNNNQ